ncbi:MAG TPA: hypothetical protein VGO03_07645 [Acidimicrobiia bacterium]|jgi:hypothetical protein
MTVGSADDLRADTTASDPLNEAVAPRWWWTLSLLLVLGGFVLRAVLLASPIGRLDSDEAIVGLMGLSIGHLHKPPLFYWGQYYGGTLEPMLVAITTRFSRTALAVKIVPLSLSVAAGYTIVRAARRMMPRPQAWLAGALLVAWPGTVWLSTKERGFYWMTLLLVTLALLVTLRLHDARPRWPVRDALLLGALCGLAWYESAQSAFVLLPLLAWLLACDRPPLRTVLQILAGGVVGGAPWLLGVAKYGSRVMQQPGGNASYTGRVHRAFGQLVPRILGVRPSYYGGWLLAGAGLVVYVALVAAVVVIAIVGIDRMRRGGAMPWWRRAATPLSLLVLLALTFPFLVAIPPTASSTFEPRYALLLVPTAALLVAWCARRFWIAALIVIAALAFGTANVHALINFEREQPAALDLRPSTLAPLERALAQEHVTRVYADYWIANPLTFDGKDGIVASPLDLPRSSQLQDTVNAARALDWVVYRNSDRSRAVPVRLAQLGVHVTRRDVGVFTIYHLDRYIDPISLGRFWANHFAGRL